MIVWNTVWYIIKGFMVELFLDKDDLILLIDIAITIFK